MKAPEKGHIIGLFALMVVVAVLVPILMASVGALIHGQSIAKSESIEAIYNIINFILGIISGYVLNSSKPDAPKDGPKDAL